MPSGHREVRGPSPQMSSYSSLLGMMREGAIPGTRGWSHGPDVENPASGQKDSL